MREISELAVVFFTGRVAATENGSTFAEGDADADAEAFSAGAFDAALASAFAAGDGFSGGCATRGFAPPKMTFGSASMPAITRRGAEGKTSAAV